MGTGLRLWCPFALHESVVKEKVAMHSSLIGKIDKAKRYAEEPQRVRFNRFQVTFKGEHDEYDVSYDNGTWHCSCAFFAGWNVCSHTLALHRMLIPMIPRDAAPAGVTATASSV
jgi:hypothetical protein